MAVAVVVEVCLGQPGQCGSGCAFDDGLGDEHCLCDVGDCAVVVVDEQCDLVGAVFASSGAWADDGVVVWALRGVGQDTPHDLRTGGVFLLMRSHISR